MAANMKQSYDVTIECKIMGTSTQSQNTLDLKNPYFRYTGGQPQPPPGENSGSPSEAYWAQMDMAGARQVSYFDIIAPVRFLTKTQRMYKTICLKILLTFHINFRQ